MKDSGNSVGLHPPAALLRWLAEAAQLEVQINGASLKFLAGAAPVVRATTSTSNLERLAGAAARAELPGLLRWKQGPAELRLWLDPGEGLDEFQLLLESSSIAKYSIEALSYSPVDGAWIGAPQDVADLQAGILRPLFSERDVSAALPAVATAAMLDFEIPETQLAEFARSIDPQQLKTLSRKFLNRQFRRLVGGRKPSRGFLYLDQLGLLDWFLPELAAGRGLTQNRYHKHDIYFHSIYSCDAAPANDLALRLSALFHDLGKVDTRREGPDGECTFHNHEVVSARHTERIMRRFGFEPQLSKKVRFLVRNHMFHYTDEWTDRAVRRFTRRVSPDLLEDLIRLRLADRTGSGKRTALPRAIKELIRHIERIRREEAELKVRDLAIDGNDLIAMGMPPGPAMGALLAELLRLVKTGQLANDPEALRQRARNAQPETAGAAR